MITREEYEFLKKLKTEGFVWIARDKNGKLFIYQEIPRRYRTIWNFGGGTVNIQQERFAFIKWEDEKPTKINDLIRDYESHQVITSERVKVRVPQCVADWIEDRKGFYTLLSLFISQDMPEDVRKWIAHDNENCERMALAWIYGYEIEKEKLYTVDLNFNQALGKRNGVIKFYDPNEKLWIVERKLTKDEIESVNPILMQIAEEVE